MTIFFIPLLCGLATFSTPNPAPATDSAFKTWTCGSDRVIGIVYLPHPGKRQHCRLLHPDPKTTLVEELNAAGTCTTRYLVVYKDHRLEMVAKTNQWGEGVLTRHFTPLDRNRLLEVAVEQGANPYAPCYGRQLTFNGRLVEEAQYVDKKGVPYSGKDGYAKETYTSYTSGKLYGMPKSIAFFDAAGRPVQSKRNGYHRLMMEYDEQGNETLQYYLNGSGQPMTNKFGVYRIRNTYDQLGDRIRIENLTPDNKPMKSNYGAATYSHAYKDGWLVQKELHDEKGKLTTWTGLDGRYAVVRYERDGHGNVLEETTYGDQREAIDDERGIHSIRSRYSDNDLLLERSYWDRAGKAVTDFARVHAYRYTYDDLGRKTSEAFLDTAGRLFSQHFAQVNMIRYQYNNSGQRLAESYWLNPSQKCTDYSGHHQKRYQYDGEGQLYSIDYLDSAGAHTVGTIGYSKEVLRYNGAGSLRSRSFFDAGQPTMLRQQEAFIRNYHTIQYEYDSLNRVSEIIYFDDHGRAVNAEVELDRNETRPCNKVVLEYKGDVVVSERLYTTNPSQPPIVRDCLKQYSIGSTGMGRRPPNKK